MIWICKQQKMKANNCLEQLIDNVISKLIQNVAFCTHENIIQVCSEKSPIDHQEILIICFISWGFRIRLYMNFTAG